MPNVTAHYADVANPDSVSNAMAEVLAKHGQIDNLVTSAGFTENFEAINYPFDRMQKLWGVNVDGTYLFAINVAKHLIERKAPGSIVMIGSMSGAIVNVPLLLCEYPLHRRRDAFEQRDLWKVIVANNVFVIQNPQDP